MPEGIKEFVSEISVSFFRKLGAVVRLIADSIKVVVDEALVFEQQIK